MKLVEVLKSQCVRRIRLTRKGGAYLPEIIQAVRERYNFAQFPQDFADFDPSRGITFRHGRWHGHKSPSFNYSVVTQLQLFDAGIFVETKDTVEWTIELLDDMIRWAVSQFNVEILFSDETTEFYQSDLEIQFDADLAARLKGFQAVGEKITETLRGYGQPSPNYEVSLLGFHYDTTTVASLKPSQFTIERRAQQPYDSNLYFSSAPLKTSDHIRLLEMLEHVVAAKVGR